MAKKNKRPKFLEKETPELLELLKKTLSDEEPDTGKALKITEELIARQPGEAETLSVDEALHKAAEQMTEALNLVKTSYDAEVAAMDDGGDDPEDDGDEDEEDEAPKKSKKGGKGSKKAKKADDDEDDDEEDEDGEDDSEEEDYTDWSLKDLKKECRTRGIKVTKGMGKSDLVKALEADDKE